MCKILCVCFDHRLIISKNSNEVEEDPSTQVMLASMQDKELVPIYLGLPDLGYVSFFYSLSSLLLNFILFPASIVLLDNILMLHQWEWVS